MKSKKPKVKLSTIIIAALIVVLSLLSLVSFVSIRGSEAPSEVPENAVVKPLNTQGGPLSSFQLAENIQSGPSASQNKIDGFKKFWVPTEVSVSSRPSVRMCKLDFETYSKNPHTFPMFRDLVTMSQCRGNNVKSDSLDSVVSALVFSPRPSFIEPTGFVFHESRVGSTLIANMLGTQYSFLPPSPHRGLTSSSLVFSESSPPASLLTRCPGCSRSRQVEMFRNTLRAMTSRYGAEGPGSVFHHAFFKFQSITVTHMDIALEAFPNTPFVFVFRNSVQTMMSHLDPSKGGSGPCLRAKGRSVPVTDAILKAGGVSRSGAATNDQYCAAHLSMLCQLALENLENYGRFADGSLRGMPVDYESLPGIVPSLVLPHLFLKNKARPYESSDNGFIGHVSEELRAMLDASSQLLETTNWRENIRSEVNFYSKSRTQSKKSFSGDNQHKENIANGQIRKSAETFLDPNYRKLRERFIENLEELLTSSGSENTQQILNDPSVLASV